MTRQDILNEFIKERKYQEERWGDVELDAERNNPWLWTSYITYYASSWQQGTFPPAHRELLERFRARMVKVGTLALAAIEATDKLLGH